VVWSNFSERAARDEEAEKANLKRLLYVMLTRARHGIIVPTPNGDDYRPGRQGTAFNEVVPDHGLELPSADEAFGLREGENTASVPGPPDAASRPGRHILPESERQGEVGSLNDEAKSGDQGIAGDPGVPGVVQLVRPSSLVDDSPVLHLQFAEAAGTYDYGRWWHTWIEMFPWEKDFEQWKDYGRQAEPPAAYDDRARKEIAALLANQELREFCTGADWLQAEFPFSWPKTSVEWCEGVVDLMIARPDNRLVVIDWKTNQAAESETPDAFADRLQQTYLPQLESYRSALQATRKTGPIQVAIYSTVLGRFV
jgi:ATP-dependent exoDNAse (exonuclease V) beta subunit